MYVSFIRISNGTNRVKFQPVCLIIEKGKTYSFWQLENIKIKAQNQELTSNQIRNEPLFFFWLGGRYINYCMHALPFHKFRIHLKNYF